MSDLIEQLRTIDTPTLSNAVERLEARNPMNGFADRSLRCLFPQFGVMCGHAITAKVETMCWQGGGLDETFVDLCTACERSPRPTVVVLQEISRHPEFSAHCGEVMATTFQRLGVIGLVSDSAVRDIPEVRGLGFHYFAPGAVASHANFRVSRVQVPVTVCGLQIAPGDLLHGDENGLLKVPPQGREELPRLADEVRNAEQPLLEFVRSDAFTIELLRQRLTH